jgi:hypothetical protein
MPSITAVYISTTTISQSGTGIGDPALRGLILIGANVRFWPIVLKKVGLITDTTRVDFQMNC